MKAGDLNASTLRLLIAIYESHSLTYAAKELNLTQPTASRELSYARQVIGDPLYIRTSHHLIPTARMTELLPEIRVVLQGLESLIKPTAPFNPATLRATFRIACVDNGIHVFLASAIKALYESAPNLRIEVESLDGHLWERMQSGYTHLTFYPQDPIPADFMTHVLYESTYSLLVKKDHPLVGLYKEKGSLDATDLLPYKKMQINVSEGAGPHKYEVAPFDINDPQEIALSLPYFLAAPFLLSKTDFTLRLPTATAYMFASHLDLAVLPCPLKDQKPFRPRIVWHRRFHSDPANQWFRSIIASSARAHWMDTMQAIEKGQKN